MDGRTQVPVNEHLRERFKADYVDTITEPGPNGILAKQVEAVTISSILRRIDISVKKHHSVGLAVVGHSDCAGNPTPRQAQEEHLRKATGFLRSRFPNLPVIALWVELPDQVEEVPV